MPVVIKTKIYSWLQKLGVFQMDPIKRQDTDQFQVPFDQEIYLQNGYLIGVALRKFVKPYSQQYQQLLKVRKIATLKSSQNQNWRIIQPFLMKFGCDLMAHSQTSGLIQISTSKIASVLEAIYDQFSPKDQQKLKLTKRSRVNHVDIYNFNPHKPPNEVQNSLQLICIILVNSFKTNLREALGLLVDKSKYLKKVIIEGSNKDDFQSVKAFYEQVTYSWDLIQQLTEGNRLDIHKILQIISEGVLSQNIGIIHQSLNILSSVKQEQWFLSSGYYKILTSNYIQCFYFTIQRLTPNYQKILNTNLHTHVMNKLQLIKILTNIIKALPKTIFSKQIFAYMPLSYFYEQCYTILNPDDIEDQPHKLVVVTLQLLGKLIITYPDKIPHSYLAKIMETFRFMSTRGYCDTYHILALLFEIVENLITKESFFTQKFFKVCMKYVTSTFGETRHWVINNLKYLYKKMAKSFPLGCFLLMYQLDSIGQADDYELFDLIADDNSKISGKQCSRALNYIERYISEQPHCKCFMQILKKLLKNHNKQGIKWGQQLSINVINKMNEINIPLFVDGQVNILNPKPPIKNRVNSIGMKRKQMMKFSQYQVSRRLLYALLQIKDKDFLHFYLTSINHAIAALEKQIGHKKKQLLNMYKTLRNRIKKQYNQIHQSQSVDQLVKSIIYDKSITSKTTPLGLHQNTTPLSQSKLVQSQSFVYTQYKKGLIIPELDQQQQNQFIDNIKTGRQASISNQDLPNRQQEMEIKQIQIIRQFTDQDQNQQNLFIYTQHMLQQNQIQYISATKLKYTYLMGYCTQLYQKYHNIYIRNNINGHSNKETIKLFMNELGISNLIQVDKFEQIFNQLESLFGHTSAENFTHALLIQMAFIVFDFKKNRRISITCFSSLLSLMEQKLKQESGQYQLKSSSSNKIDRYLLTKNIVYENRASKNIQDGKISKYVQCFSILSEIFEKGIGISLLQPISKQVNTFGAYKYKSHPQLSSEQKMNKQKQQLRMLEQQLQKETIHSPAQLLVQKTKNQPKNKVKLRFTSQTASINKITSIQKQKQKQYESTSDIVHNKQLKNRLSKRIKILQKQLSKNSNKNKILFNTNTNLQSANNNGNQIIRSGGELNTGE